MWSKIKERYYFQGGSLWVREKTKQCLLCSQKRNTGECAVVTPLKIQTVTPQPFWRINLDLFGPMKKTRSGNRYGVIAVCAFIKYTEARRNILFTPVFQLGRHFFKKYSFMDRYLLIQIS